jgi:hypothetical protein
MSTDITIYEDSKIHFAATCGSWGTRLCIAKTGIDGWLRDVEYAANLADSNTLTKMIDQLISIRDLQKDI